MFHHVDELGSEPTCVGISELKYQENVAGSTLVQSAILDIAVI